MSLDAALTLAQAKVLLARLASEPLLDSPTAEELIGQVGEDNWTAIQALFARSTVDVIMELPNGARLAVGQHMTLLSERIEASVARKAQGVALLKRVPRSFGKAANASEPTMPRPPYCKPSAPGRSAPTSLCG